MAEASECRRPLSSHRGHRQRQAPKRTSGTGQTTASSAAPCARKQGGSSHCSGAQPECLERGRTHGSLSSGTPRTLPCQGWSIDLAAGMRARARCGCARCSFARYSCGLAARCNCGDGGSVGARAGTPAKERCVSTSYAVAPDWQLRRQVPMARVAADVPYARGGQAHAG